MQTHEGVFLIIAVEVACVAFMLFGEPIVCAIAAWWERRKNKVQSAAMD